MMRNEETITKLNAMRLGAMAEQYIIQESEPSYNEMSFEDRFQLLVDYEYAQRQTNKLDRLIKQATFKEPKAAIEDIEYHPDRHLDKNLILKLASGHYIQNHHNIILMGASGTGRHGFPMHLTKPAVAQSSLSHCTTERLSIRARSTGTTSAMGRSQMTMPPE